MTGFARFLTLTVIATELYCAAAPSAQSSAPRTHITIPFLANATKPAALEFEGAECDVDTSGTQMRCAFQQLFFTLSPAAPDTCLATTNQYDRVFQRDSPTHWTSREGPVGACGITDTATLEDSGGVRWTMVLNKDVTKKDVSAACLAVKPESETFSWQNIRRALPCKNIQPGGLLP